MAHRCTDHQEGQIHGVPVTGRALLVVELYRISENLLWDETQKVGLGAGTT